MVVVGFLRLCGVEISARCVWVLCAVQMLSAKHWVAVFEPDGCLPVQRDASRFEQRTVDTLLDECVAKKISLAIGPHESVSNEPFTRIGWCTQQIPQHIEIEALPDRRRGL